MKQQNTMHHLKSICIVIPYFGRLPNYFDFWLKSCEFNSSINWLLFTDDESIHSYPSNVRVEYMSFDKFRTLLQRVFDFPIGLVDAYGLCDFKPTYGFAFQNYLKDFDFWGYGDIDLIYGNIRKFLNSEVLKSNEKILVHGHLCLMKNDARYNTIFKSALIDEDLYKSVLSSEKHYGFSEYGDRAFNTICEREGLKIYRDNLCMADIDSWKKHFQLTYVPRVCSKNELLILSEEKSGLKTSSIFEFNQGSLYRYYLKNDTLQKHEYLYVHFQKRPMNIEAQEMIEANRFVMIPNSFVPSIGSITEDFVRIKGKKKLFSNRRILWQLKIRLRRVIMNIFGI